MGFKFNPSIDRYTNDKEVDSTVKALLRKNISFTAFYLPVSHSCAVAKRRNFWQATGQSKLADRMEGCSTGQSAVLANVHDCETDLYLAKQFSEILKTLLQS